jgi:hypothetical protein
MNAVESAGGAAERGWQLWSTPVRLYWPVCRGLAVRCGLAAALLVPTALLTIRLGQPFAISAIASTSAIVLHDPVRYQQRPQRILLCYLAGIAVSVPISLAGAVVGLSALLMSASAAALIVASPVGRAHPPTVCIALAVSAPSGQPGALVGRWLMFSVLALACLAVLWLLTRHRSVQRSPCPAPRGSSCRCDAS